MSVSLSAATRYRLDDLRRLGSALASRVGVEPARASTLATQLLWFDAAGVAQHGIGTLPEWLRRIEGGEVDPKSVGRARLEHAGTAVFDGQNGVGPLALARAGGIAAEKARDVGLGVVRVANLDRPGPSAGVAAELAIGPFVAVVAGPGPALSIAVPMGEGLPAVYDSSLDAEAGAAGGGVPLGPWSPWISALTGGGPDGLVILVLAVPAMEPLTSFHDRVDASFRQINVEGDQAGWLLPATWQVTRREARERGVTLDDRATAELRGWADRFSVPWPT